MLLISVQSKILTSSEVAFGVRSLVTFVETAAIVFLLVLNRNLADAVLRPSIVEPGLEKDGRSPAPLLQYRRYRPSLIGRAATCVSAIICW